MPPSGTGQRGAAAVEPPLLVPPLPVELAPVLDPVEPPEVSSGVEERQHAAQEASTAVARKAFMASGDHHTTLW